MKDYFTLHYNGDPFQLFGLSHFSALGIILFFLIFQFYIKHFSKNRSAWIFKYSLAVLLFLNELSWHFWNYFTSQWTVQKMLPLHLCSVMVWLSIIMLLNKNYRLYEFIYFLGIGGALQSILTPIIDQYGFPHYRYFHYFISHGCIILAATYMTIIDEYRPTLESIKRVFIWSNLYLLVVFFINQVLGSNYMYVAFKPETSTPLDFFGPWPWYILGMELMALAVLGLLYVPFMFEKKD